MEKAVIEEVIVRNCEIIPSRILCNKFKGIFFQKQPVGTILKTTGDINLWYRENGFIGSFIRVGFFLRNGIHSTLYLNTRESKISKINVNPLSDLNPKKQKILKIENKINLEIIPGNFTNTKKIVSEIKNSFFERYEKIDIQLKPLTKEMNIAELRLEGCKPSTIRIEPELTLEDTTISGNVKIDKMKINNKNSYMFVKFTSNLVEYYSSQFTIGTDCLVKQKFSLYMDKKKDSDKKIRLKYDRWFGEKQNQLLGMVIQSRKNFQILSNPKKFIPENYFISTHLTKKMSQNSSLQVKIHDGSFFSFLKPKKKIIQTHSEIPILYLKGSHRSPYKSSFLISKKVTQEKNEKVSNLKPNLLFNVFRGIFLVNYSKPLFNSTGNLGFNIGENQTISFGLMVENHTNHEKKRCYKIKFGIKITNFISFRFTMNDKGKKTTTLTYGG